MNLTTVFDKPVRIIVTEEWTPEAIRQMCIHHRWYTRGTNQAYEAMFDLVNSLAPTPANMLRVAQDIANHSVNDRGEADVELILYTIANEAVLRNFEL